MIVELVEEDSASDTTSDCDDAHYDDDDDYVDVDVDEDDAVRKRKKKAGRRAAKHVSDALMP